jgi:site-specific recombinase XerD
LDRIINLWLKKERRSYVNADGDYFFPSKHGEKMTASAVYRIVHKNAEKAGIQEIIGTRGDGSPIYKVHTHVLRHSYATHAVEDDIPLNHLKEYMGHSQITTTLRYTGKIGIFSSYYKNFKGV